ncbi:MAG TPA: MFS transporter, partial [Pseudomonadales bacterium]|nr:MFS transporter [Pseudomonadales bacterium]
IGLFNTGGRLLTGVLGDRYDPRYLLGAGLLVQLLGIVVLDQTTQPWIAYLFAVLFGIGYGMASVASFPLIANYFGASSYARLFSVRSLVATALGAVGPVAAAMAHDSLHSYRPVFLGFAAIALLMVVMAITMRPPLPPTAD